MVRALSAYYAEYERTTAAVDADVTLNVEAEARLLRACVDFYTRNIQRGNAKVKGAAPPLNPLPPTAICLVLF